MTPRRIAYVLNIFPKLSETFIADELAELQRRGLELKILSLRPPRDEIRHPIISLAGLDKLVEYGLDQFSPAIEQFRPGLIHAHFAREATGKARELSMEHNVPFTFTAHGYDIYRKPPSDFQARALAASAVVTVSQANADYIHRTFDVPRSRLQVIPCGVDVNEFCPSPNDLVESGPPRIVCVARLVPVKNLGFLLEACAALRERELDFRCLILGEGPGRSELEAMRARLKLEDVVQMPGAANRDTVRECWRQAAIGVLTSENEGMPVSLMEAAACGVPVVATCVGGIPELVLDGVTGILTAPGDPVQFAQAVERLIVAPELRRELGINARAHAEKRFSIVRQADALLELWSAKLQNCPA